MPVSMVGSCRETFVPGVTLRLSQSRAGWCLGFFHHLKSHEALLVTRTVSWGSLRFSFRNPEGICLALEIWV